VRWRNCAPPSPTWCWAEQLAATADELGVTDIVRFHGHVPDATRDALLDASWLMLAPSVKEGWGIAIMEAAARSVPTIAYETAGGVTESIVHGETGLLVADPGELVEKTRLLLSDTELRLAMGLKASDRARRFGWAESCAAFAELVLDDAREATTSSRRS
jgi:glycosyltransferase involved in cell wall biosynthesis